MKKPPHDLAQARTDAPAPPVFRTEELFKRSRVIVILHQNKAYQLRITQANKLILTA